MVTLDKRALIIGRFQPFHNGHLRVVRKIATGGAQFILGIGSAQVSHTQENPFTAGERILMISRALEEAGLPTHFFIPIEDVNRHSVWVSHVESLCPPFDVVYTNNPLSKRLFSERGYRVVSSPLYNRKVYSGTEIRRRIAAGGRWEHLVPPAVKRTITAIHGVGRIRELVSNGKG